VGEYTIKVGGQRLYNAGAEEYHGAAATEGARGFFNAGG
jgi:hypothetical protein